MVGREYSAKVMRQLLKDLDDRDDFIVWRAQEAFTDLTVKELEQIEELLIHEMLKDEDSKVVEKAAMMLVDFSEGYSVQYNDAVEPLVELMNHKDESVRFMAHYTLAEINGDRGFEEAINLLKHEDNCVVISAIGSLERYLDDETDPCFDEAVKHLSDLLESTDESIREKAANAMMNIQKHNQ